MISSKESKAKVEEYHADLKKKHEEWVRQEEKKFEAGRTRDMKVIFPDLMSDLEKAIDHTASYGKSVLEYKYGKWGDCKYIMPDIIHELVEAKYSVICFGEYSVLKVEWK